MSFSTQLRALCPGKETSRKAGLEGIEPVKHATFRDPAQSKISLGKRARTLHEFPGSQLMQATYECLENRGPDILKEGEYTFSAPHGHNEHLRQVGAQCFKPKGSNRPDIPAAKTLTI